jgi:hypothetical protein
LLDHSPGFGAAQRSAANPFLSFCRFDVTGTRMSLPIALVVGIAVGGATLLAAAAVLLALWCAARRRARRNRNSDTGSSDPSTLGG